MIETDSRLVRELPAGYVAEHVEHAYALTGHGMQGATVEAAIVVASPRDLTAGWSYTALSRARGTTRLLDPRRRSPSDERGEYAPDRPDPAATRDELLARVARRMLERDDQDLAIEQLPAAGRADDPQLASAARIRGRTTAGAARRARRTRPGDRGDVPARLRELGERLEQLSAQLAALPTRELQRIDDLDARALKLTSQREQLAGRLAELPEPHRRLGREHDAHLDRPHPSHQRAQANERELDARPHTARRAWSASSATPARSAPSATASTTRSPSSPESTPSCATSSPTANYKPPAWAQDAFGERPAGPRSARTGTTRFAASRATASSTRSPTRPIRSARARAAQQQRNGTARTKRSSAPSDASAAKSPSARHRPLNHDALDGQLDRTDP